MSEWEPKADEKVVVKKGAVVYSTYPDWPALGRPSRRSSEVVVYSVERYFRTQTKDQQTVRWVGAGGYWKWCALEDTKPAPSDLEKLAKLGRAK